MNEITLEQLIANKIAYRQQCLNDLRTLYMGYTARHPMDKLKEVQRINAEIQRIDNEIAILRRSGAWFDIDMTARRERIRRMTTERIRKQQTLEDKTATLTRETERHMANLQKGVFDSKLLQKLQSLPNEVRRLTEQIKQLDDDMRGLTSLVTTGLMSDQQLGTYAILYNKENYGGDSWIIIDNLSDVDNVIGHCHAIKVGDRTCVELYGQTGYQGISQPIYSDIPQLDTHLNVDQLFKGMNVPKLPGLPSQIGSSRTRLGSSPRSFRLLDASKVAYEGGWAIQTADQKYLSMHDGVVTTRDTVGKTEVFAFKLHRLLTDTEIDVSIEIYDIDTGDSRGSMRIDGVSRFTLVDEVNTGRRLISLKDDERWLTYDTDTRTFSFTTDATERAILRRAIKVAANERVIGTLLAGEVALYEHQNYWGKTWVFYRDFANFGSVLSLNNRVSSIRVGKGTGATIYRNEDYKQPEFNLGNAMIGSLIPDSISMDNIGNTIVDEFQRTIEDKRIRYSKESIYQDMPTLTDSDVGDDAISAIRVWTITHSLPHYCTLSQDYRLRAGELSTFSSYRVTLDIPVDVETVTITATDRVTIQHEGKTYTIDEDQNHVFNVTTIPSLLLTMPARGLQMPALKVRTDTMPSDTYFLIFPDEGAHRRLLDLPPDALATATDRQGRSIVTNEQLSSQQMNMFQQAIQTTLQSVRYETTLGSDERGLNTSVFNEEAWVLDFGEIESTRLTRISHVPLSVRASSRSVSKKQETTIFEDIAGWFNQLGETIEDVVIEPALEWGDNVLSITIETAKEVVKFIVSTAEAVLEFIEGILAFIGIQLKAFIEFLEYTFDWDAILKTQTVFNSAIEQGTRYAATFVNKVQVDVMAYLDDVESNTLAFFDDNIEELGGSIQIHEAEDTPVTNAINEAIDKVMWVIDKLNEYAADIADMLPSLDIDLDIINQLKEIQRQILTLAGDSAKNIINVIDSFIKLIELIIEDPSNLAAALSGLLSIFRQLVATGLEMAKGVINLVLESVSLIIATLNAFLNLPLPIPFFADLFASITDGEKLTVRNIFTLILAIPTSAISQNTIGRVLFDGQLPQFISDTNPPTFSKPSAPDTTHRDLSIAVAVLSIINNKISVTLDCLSPVVDTDALTKTLSFLTELTCMITNVIQNILQWILVGYGDGGIKSKVISSISMLIDVIAFCVPNNRSGLRRAPQDGSDRQEFLLRLATELGALSAIINSMEFIMEFEDKPAAIMGHISNIVAYLPDGFAMCRSQDILERTKGKSFGVFVGASSVNAVVQITAASFVLGEQVTR